MRRRLEIAALWLVIALIALLTLIAVGWSFASGVGAADRPLIVAARAEVQPGDVFSITLTSFADAPAYTLPVDSRLEVVAGDGVAQGGALVFPATEGVRTLVATFRVKPGARAGDVVFPGGAVVRVCCVGPVKVFLPVFRG